MIAKENQEKIEQREHKDHLNGMQYQSIEYGDPLDYLAHFKDASYTILLHSSKSYPFCHSSLGRYSYLMTHPVATLRAKNGQCWVNEILTEHLNPFDALQSLFNDHKPKWQLEAEPKEASIAEYPPFKGGLAGYFGYELYQHLESIPFAPVDDLITDDMRIGVYLEFLAFDHLHQKAWLCTLQHGPLSQHIQQISKRTMKTHRLAKAAICTLEDIQSNFSQETYIKAVKQTQEYILAGDIFEGTVAQRFEAPCPVDAFTLYQRLYRANPAPFAAYLKFNEYSICSASPERFLKCQDRQVETRPIKGTARRSTDAIEDEKIAQHLSQSEKDRAENVMIVDLMRNDLSKVCKPHTVQVPILCGVETYETVHHLVSVVTGTLENNKTLFDLLKACFPGGSITGAPKIRAMEIIAELEPHHRGPYCGSIGYIDWALDCDLSITIRTLILKNGKAYFHTGGAITLGSEPELEWQESLTKASALKDCLTATIIHDRANI